MEGKAPGRTVAVLSGAARGRPVGLGPADFLRDLDCMIHALRRRRRETPGVGWEEMEVASEEFVEGLRQCRVEGGLLWIPETVDRAARRAQAVWRRYRARFGPDPDLDRCQVLLTQAWNALTQVRIGSRGPEWSPAVLLPLGQLFGILLRLGLVEAGAPLTPGDLPYPAADTLDLSDCRMGERVEAGEECFLDIRDLRGFLKPYGYPRREHLRTGVRLRRISRHTRDR